MVGFTFTNRYHASILGGTRGHTAFTNHYLLGDTTHKGIGQVAGIGHQGAGWARVIAVDNVEHR